MISYIDDNGTTQWHIPVFSLKHARFAFSHCRPEVHIWGMLPPATKLLLSYQDATEFFAGVDEQPISEKL